MVTSNSAQEPLTFGTLEKFLELKRVTLTKLESVNDIVAFGSNNEKVNSLKERNVTTKGKTTKITLLT